VAERRFAFTRIDTRERSWQTAWPRLDSEVLPRWRERGVVVWGAFHGLFGIASSDLVLLTFNARGSALPEVSAAEGVIRESYEWRATARPHGVPSRLDRPGLYVFRFFEVAERDVDEIVRLSAEAWTTFEGVADYRAEPLALFRAAADVATSEGRMLLLTWYDGFGSWERSRRPAPAARENFARRHALTRGTVAYATRLVGSE